MRHTLAAEGAAFDDNGQRRYTTGYRSLGVAGEGRAKCACGDMSPVLPSAYQRKKWHRAHKEASRA